MGRPERWDATQAQVSKTHALVPFGL
ncbi:rCG63480 [Rattus norvegicus]|uniref:RCG63480 n=1 Tax=Rattus norvegicus TaxID=10116 RepID=A6HDE3_RAT|nr:rCG63480 [Rattus norvegicus]